MSSGVMDHVLDSLTEEEYLVAVEYIISRYNTVKDVESLTKTEEQTLQSLVTAGVVAVDGETIRYFFNHFDSEIYCLKASKIKKCSPIDLAKIPDYQKQIRERITDGLKESTRFYVVMKDQNATFKIRDSKTTGYVCKTTSSLTTKELKNRLNIVIDGLFSDKSVQKLSKNDLCLLYEIVGRVYMPWQFQRPHFVKIESNKKK